jgi:oligoendopeptidase F
MTTATTFVPDELDASSWSTLEPLYRALLERELRCDGCLEQLLLDRSELDAAASEARANLYIRMTRYTDDEDAKRAYLAFEEEVVPALKKAGFELDRKIAGSPHRAKLDAERYGVLLRGIDADVEIFRDENVPLQTEDTKLGQEYAEKCGAMTVEFRGETHTGPQMAKYLEETDRATREEAWRLVAERRRQDHERFDEILTEMIGLRHAIAGNAGFGDYTGYAFTSKHRFDYTPADCAEFHRAAEEVCVPLRRRLNEGRRAALGVETLRPWDLAVDVKGRSPLRPFAGADELVGRTSSMFHRMEGGLGGMFDTLREGDCLDLESRVGKAPGGYQYMRDRARRPFIFMNATGLHGDLSTLVHEAGHAFHSMYCVDEPLVHYRHSPLEFAEVASMSMEMLVFPYLGEFYDEEQANRARREHLEDLVRLFPWVATIDAFQHWMYAHPEHTAAERRATWLELDDRFGSAISWDGLEPYRETSWQRQLHIFEVPFYYIEYGIAQLGAVQMWLEAREDEGAALRRYEQALSLGGSRPLPELFASAGLDFDFGPATMRRLMDAVEEELERLPE